MLRLQPIRAILSLAVFALVHPNAHAQWVQTSGPRGGTVSSLVTVPDDEGGTRLYAGQVRLWSTNDRGSSWSYLDNGLTDPNAFSLIAVPTGSGGNDILVGTNGGIFRSRDDGASWSPVNNGLTNFSVYALAAGPDGSGGTNLYAGTFMGNAFRSTDNGASWVPIQSGLPTGFNVNEMITTSAGTVLAGTMNGIYRSTDLGGSWTRVFTSYGFSFAKNGSTLYSGTSDGVYRSSDDGATWSPINAGLGFTWVYSMAAIPSASGVTLFAGAGRVLRSADNGATWQIADNGLTSIGVYALATAPNGGGGSDLYAGTGEGVFRTSDNGDSWTNVSFVYSQVSGLEVTPSGAVLAATDSDVFRSSDGGATWTDTNSQSNPLDFAVNLHGTSGVSLFACSALVGISKSTDDGVTWTDSNNDIGDIEVNSLAVVPNSVGSSNVLAGTYSGVFLSTNDGGSWQPVNPAFMPLDWVVTPNSGGGHDVFGGGFNGEWVSSNYGMTWLHLGVGGIVQGMAATENGAKLFAAGDPFGVYRSTDHGATWTLVNDGLADLRLFALLSPDGTHLFAGGAGGVFLSSNNGDSWSSVATGLPTGVHSLAASADGSTLLAGTTGRGVWKRAISEMIDSPTAAHAGDTFLPSAITLRASYPNPLVGATTIHYALPRAMSARFVVYDVAGRAVRTLVDGNQEAGELRAIWDGRDASGSRVGRGIYLYRLEAAGTSLTRKLIVR